MNRNSDIVSILTMLLLSCYTLLPACSLAQPPGWKVEYVDNPRLFTFLTDRSIAMDEHDHPHIAYGEDHLYHAWYDGTAWQYETADPEGNVGNYAAIVLEDGRYPHISYEGHNGLKYAYNDGPGWHSYSVETGEFCGQFTSIALDSDGYPHISHYDYGGSSTHFLKYAFEDDSGWHIETVFAGDGGEYTSLAIDENGYPHISYQLSDNLGYAYKDDFGWHLHEIETEAWDAIGTSIALDGDGYPHISYKTQSIKYAYLDESGWHIEVLEGTSYTTGYTSITIDDSGHPHVAYKLGTALTYAYRDDGTWNLEALTSAVSDVSLTLTSDGYPGIAHLNSLENHLHYRYKDGTGWHTELVDAEQDGRVGHYTSLAISNNGFSHICYGAVPQPDWGILKYARQTQSGWTFLTIDSSGEVGSHSSIALDPAGYPHISYHDIINWVNNGRLKYAFENASGWHVQILDEQEQAGKFTSIKIDDNGFPHISYYVESVYRNLKYAYRTDLGWHLEVVDTQGSVGEHTSLALDSGGYPHISYYDGSNTALKYASKDETGWSMGIVDNSGEVGRFTSLVLDENDYPHISYQDETNKGLKYAFFDGTIWDMMLVDCGDDGLFYTSIALDTEGNPQIAYYASTEMYYSGMLKYAFMNEEGWQILIIEDQGVTGYHVSLALDQDGLPRMSYNDYLGGDLKYAALLSAASSLTGEIADGQLTLTWTPVLNAAEYWVYGASNYPFFNPGSAPDYQFRLAVLPNGTTTWSSLSGIGNPGDNWTYTVLSVTSTEEILTESNRIGEMDLECQLP